MKAAFASSGLFDPRKMWPDHFRDDLDVVETDDIDKIADEEAAIDFSNVKWETPSDGNEQALADLAALRTAMSGRTVAVTDGPIEDGLSGFVPVPDGEWV